MCIVTIIWQAGVYLLAPVGGRLLRDELDVEEGALPGAVDVPVRRPPHDSRRHVRHDVLSQDNVN